MWGLALVKMSGGSPQIDTAVTPYVGHILVGHAGGWGGYLISGSAAQLTALNALPEVVGICVMTESGGVKWVELDNVITPAMRTKLNTYLTSKGLSTVPVNWTNRQIVLAVFRRMNPEFDLDKEWVAD
jgi:hypothetical protein